MPPLEPASPELETSIPELLKAAFSLVIPGRRIPDWIRNQDCSSKIELELPPSWFNSNVLAFAFAVVYNFPLPLSHRSSGWVSADCNFYSHHSSWHYAVYPQTTKGRIGWSQIICGCFVYNFPLLSILMK